MKNIVIKRAMSAILSALMVLFSAGIITAQQVKENKKKITEKTKISGEIQDRNVEFAKMRSPQRLARQIRNELLTLPYYSVFDWLEFEVDRSGVVTLSGQVTTPPDTKSRAEAYVKDVEGVTRVINNIEVLPVSPNDERLRQTLYREIYSGPLFRYQVGSLQAIHIIVKNGRATLKGVVDSEGDKNIAGIRAKTVSGLFEVNNELVVENGENRMR